VGSGGQRVEGRVDSVWQRASSGRNSSVCVEAGGSLACRWPEEDAALAPARLARVPQRPAQPVLAIACWGQASYTLPRSFLWLGQIPPPLLSASASQQQPPPLRRPRSCLDLLATREVVCWPSRIPLPLRTAIVNCSPHAATEAWIEPLTAQSAGAASEPPSSTPEATHL
jgi:hypothetical protein